MTKCRWRHRRGDVCLGISAPAPQRWPVAETAGRRLGVPAVPAVLYSG